MARSPSPGKRGSQPLKGKNQRVIRISFRRSEGKSLFYHFAEIFSFDKSRLDLRAPGSQCCVRRSWGASRTSARWRGSRPTLHSVSQALGFLPPALRCQFARLTLPPLRSPPDRTKIAEPAERDSLRSPSFCRARRAARCIQSSRPLHITLCSSPCD